MSSIVWESDYPNGEIPEGFAEPVEMENLRLAVLEERLAHARRALTAAAMVQVPHHRREVLALAGLAAELHLAVAREIERG